LAQPLLIVGLGGSLAATSRSRAALRVALAGAEGADAETTLLDLRELDLPMYNPEIRDPPASGAQLLEVAYASDGMIWSSPLYQGTISGAFKNALDWLHLLDDRDPPYLHDKVIGLVSTAGGTQGLQAVNTMEFCVRALRAWAVPLVVPIASAHRAFDPDGTLRDEAAHRQLTMLGAEVVRVAGLFGREMPHDPEEECTRAADRVTAAA
jgi:FMN reductase